MTTNEPVYVNPYTDIGFKKLFGTEIIRTGEGGFLRFYRF